jgi:hypothetical protein
LVRLWTLQPSIYFILKRDPVSKQDEGLEEDDGLHLEAAGMADPEVDDREEGCRYQ